MRKNIIRETNRNRVLCPEKKVRGISQGSNLPTPGQGDQNQSDPL
jgi:hypothetical protein